MLIEPIRHALENIKSELTLLSDSSRVIYEMQPIVNITKQVVDLIERNGIPKLEAEKIKSTGHASSRYFNDLARSMRSIMVITSRIIAELTENTNTIMDKYVDKVNLIDPIMQDLRTRIADLQAQTLEKVTNTDIHDNEVKNINFSNNVEVNDLTIVNNTLLLPIASRTQLQVNDVGFTILQSDAATKKLHDPFVATLDKLDSETIIGTYFGNMVGMLDGSEAFISEDDISIDALYNTSINEILIANYYSNKLQDQLQINIDNQFNQQVRLNYIAINSNVAPITTVVSGGENIKIQMKNNIWAQDITAENIIFTLEQTKQERLRYQAIDVIDKNTSTVIKKHNYFSSLAHIFPETLNSLNSDIDISAITVTPQQTIRLSERVGMYKYSIDVTSMDFYMNTYNLTGIWQSEFIITNSPIVAVELSSDHIVPDDQLEYISYQISFDKNTWYQIKATNEGITPFNSNKKHRIVLNNNNDNSEYLFIGNQSNNMGVYLRVNMQSTSAINTPVIYNLQLKIKVDTNV